MASSLGGGSGNDEAGREFAYLAATGTMIVGIAVAALGSTALTTRAGDHHNGAIYTSLYLAILLLSLAIAVPYTPRLCEWLGSPRRAFVFSILPASLIWAVGGVLILAGAPTMAVMLPMAAAVGAMAGFYGALSPLYARAYICGEDMAGAYARLSVAGGLSFALGSSAGGFLLNLVNPAYGLLARALLGLPLAIFVLRVLPDVEPSVSVKAGGTWAGLRKRLSNNHELRSATLLGCGVALFAAPMVSMVVPIVDSLRLKPLLPGAGILMVGMSVGELFSPVVVSKLQRGRTEIRASAIAAVGCALSLALYGLVSLVLADRSELAAWALVGAAFGAMRYGGRALNIGAAVAATDDEDSADAVAAFVFTTSLAAPAGVLLWGLVINRVSTEAAIFGGAVGTALIAGLWLSRREATAAAD